MTRHRGEFVQMSEGYRLPGADAARQIISKSMEVLREEIIGQSVLEREQLLAEAARVLQEAQEQAEHMLNQGLEERLDAVLEEGRQHGFNAGYEAGLEQIRQETLTLAEGANQIVDKACFAEQRMLHQFKNTAADLITQLCEKIVSNHMLTHPECVLDMIDQAIEQLALGTQIRLVVSHELLEHLKQVVNPLADDLLENKKLQERFQRLAWVSDKQLERFQVFLQSREGHFDLSPQTQIATLVKAIQPSLHPPELEV